MLKEPLDNSPKSVEFNGSVLQQIRRHARSSMKAEVCGILIGGQVEGVTRVEACIAGENAAQGGAHVTFTQNTWEHIYKVKDAKFPDRAIVGWYHSHPGFGIFLSEYDIFIHENFFREPFQVAWVFDPHSDDEGCFGWIEKKVKPLARISVLRDEEIVEKKIEEPVGKSAESTASTSNGVSPARFNFFLANMVAIIVLVLVFVAGLLLGPIVDRRIFTKYRVPSPSSSNQIAVPKPKTDTDSLLAPSPVDKKSHVSQKTTPSQIIP